MNITETVKQICKARGLALADVAQKIGVSASSLSQIMKGNPTLSKLTAIAEALDVPVSEILSDGEVKSKVRCPNCGHLFPVSIKAEEGTDEDGTPR
ncbi:MAG: helix-turn-helix transcriptional regulator [Bacteroidales bacterium]|nr:helix-turn-helix transcriptional regulator [Bacteroidales bacterium]